MYVYAYPLTTRAKTIIRHYPIGKRHYNISCTSDDFQVVGKQFVARQTVPYGPI